MQKFKKKSEMREKREKGQVKVIGKFIPFSATARNMAVPHIAKDKHKMWLDNAYMEICQIKACLNECKKNELAMSAKLH